MYEMSNSVNGRELGKFVVCLVYRNRGFFFTKGTKVIITFFIYLYINLKKICRDYKY
jgi:hypothetical protein